jgi:hypothetical protein
MASDILALGKGWCGGVSWDLSMAHSAVSVEVLAGLVGDVMARDALACRVSLYK